jgi:hypothetical protein
VETALALVVIVALVLFDLHQDERVRLGRVEAMVAE